MRRRAQQWLSELGVAVDASVPVRGLSIAHQQMVEIAKALSFNSSVLIMDEPTAALTDTEVATLFRMIDNFVNDETGVVYISHRMEEIYRICDRVTVLRDGELVVSDVTATFDRDPKFKTDRLAGGLAEFSEGRHLSFTISTQLAPYQRANIMGTKGRIEIEIPFNAPPDKPNRYFIQGMAMNEGQWIELPVSDQYQLQAEAFGRAIRKKKAPVWGVADAIQNMKIIDAFFRSEKRRKWAKP